jgi:hypothetical protein
VNIVELRKAYQLRIRQEIIRISHNAKRNWDYPNFADGDNRNSVAIANGIVTRLPESIHIDILSGQTKGRTFESITKEYLEESFGLLQDLRPGNWVYSTQMPINRFDQYEHLAGLETLLATNVELSSILGRDYIITPDIVIGRRPISDAEINRSSVVITEDPIAGLTPLRSKNKTDTKPILHASISCKWTLRSDRGQNARTEAINLIRNRKGNLPHVVAVTGEPLPTRIASLALGTGDLDCVYHFGLYEMQEAIEEIKAMDIRSSDQIRDQDESLQALIDGRRIRDISDLPFDLAI